MYVCNPKHNTSKIKIQLFCLLYVVMLKSSVVRFVQRFPTQARLRSYKRLQIGILSGGHQCGAGHRVFDDKVRK